MFADSLYRFLWNTCTCTSGLREYCLFGLEIRQGKQSAGELSNQAISKR